MLESKESLEESANYVRLAIPMMSSHDVPITPRNYAVWYEYVSGKNEELREAIDSHVKKRRLFTEEANQKFYERFCAGQDEGILSELRENLRQLLLKVYAEVADMSGEAEKYESVVSESVNKLSEEASIQDIKDVVDEIIGKTKEIGASGRAMQQKLTEATEELEVIKKDFEQAKAEARVDFLTELANRMAFDEMLAKNAAEAAAEDEPLTLLLLDIDHFKQFNDEHGHLIGDRVLKLVAKKTMEVVKGRDFVARYGGEEFAVILPQTPLAGAKAVAENIRLSFAKGKLKDKATADYLGKLTVSIGVAQYRPGEAVEGLVKRSDQALYLAKDSGRNRVATETDLE